MSAPIGSIVAYAGPVDAAWETTNGWMACDGRECDRTDPAYTPLWDATARLPSGEARGGGGRRAQHVGGHVYTVLGFNLVGDGLRDLLDPKSRA